jgi:hypothetical protein
MNFEEHCEILLSSKARTADDADFGVACWRRARKTVPKLKGGLRWIQMVPHLIAIFRRSASGKCKLEKSTTTAPHIRLKTRLEELQGDPRFNFLFSGMLVGDTMVDARACSARSPVDSRLRLSMCRVCRRK